MKTILILATMISSSAFAVTLPSRSECQARQDSAVEAVEAVEDRFSVGEVTRTDVARTKLSLVDIRISCADIVRGSTGKKGSYCSQANMTLLETYVNGVKEEVQVGMRDAMEYSVAKDYEITMRANCN